MMNFFKSEDIRIFPCTYRGLNTTASALISEDNQKYIKSLNIDPESHMLSEYNLTTLANYPAGKNSYIIDKDSTTLDCVIKGYHIRIANLNKYYTWSGSLYLAIKTKAYPLTEAVAGKAAYGIEYLFPFGLTKELAKAAEAATTPLSLDYCGENNCSYCYAVGYTGTAKEAGANECYYLQITDDDGAIVAKNLVTNIVEFYKDNNTNILNGNTKIAGDITIEKTATAKGNFTATGSITANGTLAVIGETTLQNKLTVKPSAKGATVLTVQPNKVEITGELNTTKSIICAGGLVANGSIQANKGLTVANGEETSLGGTLNVTDEITANNGIEVKGTTSLQATNINGKLKVAGGLEVEDNLEVDDNISATTISIKSNALQVDGEGKTKINDLTAAAATITNATINGGTANLSQVTADSGAIGNSLNVTGAITADTITGATIKAGDKEGDTIINSTTVKSQEADFGDAKITTAEVTSLTVKDGATISYDAKKEATTVSGSLILSAVKMLKVDTIQASKSNGNVFVNSAFKAGTTTLKNLSIRNFNGTPAQSEDEASLTVTCRNNNNAAGPGSVIIREPLTVKAAATFENTVTATNLTATNLTVTGKLNCDLPSGEDQHTITGTTNINGNTTVNGKLKVLENGLEVKGGAIVDCLTVGSTTPTAKSGEIIAQELNICSGGLQVDNKGKTTINDLTATTATIVNDFSAASGTIGGSLNVTNNITSKSLTIKDGATISYDAENNYTTVSVPRQQQLFIQSKTIINNTLSAGTTTLKALTVNGNTNIDGNFRLKSTAIEQVIFDLANPVGTVFTAIRGQVPENYFSELGITSYWKYLGEESVGETIIRFWQRVKTVGEKVDPPPTEEPTQE